MEQVLWLILLEEMLEGASPILPTNRITENLIDRITEDGTLRITE